jgi:hypothetical protein
MCRLSWNLGASNFWHPQDLSRPVMRLRYLFFTSNETKSVRCYANVCTVAGQVSVTAGQDVYWRTTEARFTHSMPRPYLSPAMPCRWGFRMCLSHLIYTVRPRLIHTCHAEPMPCFDHAVLLKTTAQYGRRVTCPRSASSGYHAEFHEVVIRSIPILDAGGQCATKNRLSWSRKRVVSAHYKKDDLLHCWTSSSDISGYHENFHGRHGTVGAGQGRGMACVN